MKIINKKNQIIVADKVKVADNPFTRLVGLLNRTSLDSGEGLLILPCNGIHSFFMKFEFDAVFLDKENNVKFTIERMKPWKVSPMVFTAAKILELPAGIVKVTDIKIKDQLIIE